MMVLMTLPVRGHKTSTLGDFFTIRSEGSWKSKLPRASISHFAFHPEKPAQSHWWEWWWPCPQNLGRWHSQGPGWEQLAVDCICSCGVCTVAF